MAPTFQPQVAANPPAREIMKTSLVTLRPDTNVFDAVKLLIKHKISGAPVVDEDNRLLGVFSEKSVMKVLVEAAYEQVPVDRIDGLMNTNPKTINENTQLVSMAQIFLNSPCRRLPVVKDGVLVGQVSRRDVVQASIGKAGRGSPSVSDEKHLLYLSALREMSDAPNV